MLYYKPHRIAPRPLQIAPPEEACYLDSAELLLRLQTEGRTRADMARLTGLTTQQVAERLRLGELDEGLRSCLRRERVPERIALTLLTLPDALTRRRIAARIIRERLCIRDAALLIASARQKCVRMCQEHRQHGQQVRLAIRDTRPYRNAIRDIAGQMNAAGLRTTFTERRNGSLMELTIAYSARRRRMERYQSM